ncbi:MAG: creatininase family protein [Geminicoccaceae bacterium]|nr:MAG: creatininase family protein [Geminicoccaceae bacterium]
MTALPRRHWVEMTSPDFAAVDPERWLAVLPVGAVEQHGPHLPLMVDAAINQGIVARALAKTPEALPVTVLPMTWVGRSEEHLAYPGSLTHSAETLRRMWYEIGASVARAGLRKLLVLNSHGGQIQVMQIVARQLRIDHDMFVAAVSWPQLGLPEGLIDDHERRHGIHAGEIETSLMLALHPDQVRQDQAQNFTPLTRRADNDFPHLMGLGAAGFGWMAQDLHPTGAAGNAKAASAQTGKAILDHVASRLVALFEEMVRYPLANVRAGREEKQGGT